MASRTTNSTTSTTTSNANTSSTSPRKGVQQKTATSSHLLHPSASGATAAQKKRSALSPNASSASSTAKKLSARLAAPTLSSEKKRAGLSQRQGSSPSSRSSQSPRDRKPQQSPSPASSPSTASQRKDRATSAPSPTPISATPQHVSIREKPLGVLLQKVLEEIFSVLKYFLFVCFVLFVYLYT